MRQQARFSLAFLMGCLLTSSAAVAQTKADRIDELMAHYHALGRHHGAVLVAQDGEVVYEGGFGPADATWGIPNAPDVKYGIGSITKTFTALLVMQQVERGALRLDAPAANYLPDLPAPLDGRITVEHLLTHRSGLVDYVNDLGGDEYMARYEHRRVPADSVVADMARQPLEFEPGRGYDYSNTGYVLLGLVLEAVTGRSYCALLHEDVFAQSGMEGSGCTAFEPVVPRLATPYEEEDGVLTHAPFFHANFADGVVYSTVRDLYRFDRALRSGRLLTPEVQAAMNTPRVEDDFIGDDYGRGLQHFYGYGVETHRRPGTSPPDSVTVVGHGGGYTGWGAMLWRVPEDGVVIAVLNNQHIPPLYPEIFDVLYDRPYHLPTEEELEARQGIGPDLLGGGDFRYRDATGRVGTWSISTRSRKTRGTPGPLRRPRLGWHPRPTGVPAHVQEGQGLPTPPDHLGTPHRGRPLPGRQEEPIVARTGRAPSGGGSSIPAPSPRTSYASSSLPAPTP